jgi:hypothetical protein
VTRSSDDELSLKEDEEKNINLSFEWFEEEVKEKLFLLFA